MLMTLKRLAENVPEPIGRFLTVIPFSWRLGPEYTRNEREIHRYQQMSSSEQQRYVFERVRNIVEYAYQHNDFYRHFYQQRSFTPDQLKEFDSIKSIPVVTKAILRQFPLERRSIPETGRILINTGGTSGEPLHFYLDRNAFAREWGHMHYIWSRLGYTQYCKKLTFRGRNLGEEPLKYNAVNNEYLVNAYRDQTEVVDALSLVLNRSEISFLHGYPSFIYDFARFCKKEAPFIVERLNASLRGVLLASEYPAPVYRNTIESVFKAPTISWYGHSEAAVLAFEASTKYRYEPLMTYGYAEAVEDEHGRYHLVATSYYNTVSPFIRYDTGDIIVPEWKNQMLNLFRISEGRVGEFIEDKRGRRISLTALIFGRHHKIFESARFVQVRQTEPGKATIIMTLPQEIDNGRSSMVDKGFDFDDIEIDFSFEVRSKPYTTSSGKVPLLIKTQAS